MSRNNDVFHLLVTKGNQAVLAKDKKVTELLPGQIGIFNYDTNLSFDATVATAPRNFYLAVGIDAGNGTTGDIMKSAGSHVQGKNIAFYSFRPYTPGRPMKVLLKDYVADCETEYGVKLELRNQEIYRTQGYNQFTKTYTMKTSCCDECEPTCPSGDANEITKQLLVNVLNDPSGLITARAVARQALTAVTHGVSANIAKGGVVSSADLEAIMAYNATQTNPANFVYTDLEIETVPQTIQDFSAVSLNYMYPRQTVAILTKVGDFKCSGTVTTTQTAVFEEGAGIDVKQLEYQAKGWTESPYRVSTVNGVADNRVYITDASSKYDVFALTYDQFSLGGWLEYFHNQASIIAIPTADTVTRNGLAAILDKVAVAQSFEPLTDDAAAAVVDPTVIEKTTDKTVTTDGISG
jgi:hypothetical protein